MTDSAREVYDLIIIGAGPGGYVAAIRAAQLGLRVALVEKEKTLGGTCLNVGCIPSKALLDISEAYFNAQNHYQERGIEFADLRLNLARVHEKKSAVVTQLTDGLAQLMKDNGVRVFNGVGTITSPTNVKVVPSEGDVEILETTAILIATGSVPATLPFLPFDGERILSSTEALNFTKIPEKLIVIGAGVIGLELGSVWGRLGAQVTVIELLPQLLPGVDARIAKMMRPVLKKQGITLMLETRTTGYKATDTGVKILATDKKGNELEVEGNCVLVAVGRKPFTTGLGLEQVGVIVSPQTGKIEVDTQFRTSVGTIYAIGDVIDGPMLAHKAEEEGIAVAEILAGKPGLVNHDTIPSVVYTWPEIASVGKTEEQLKATGVEYNTGIFNFRANGRALCMDSTDGFVKILADKQTDKVLGVHIMGPWASDLISEAVSVMEFGGSAEDIARTCHSHPTLSEAVKEAALAVEGRAIHASPPRR